VIGATNIELNAPRSQLGLIIATCLARKHMHYDLIPTAVIQKRSSEWVSDVADRRRSPHQPPCRSGRRPQSVEPIGLAGSQRNRTPHQMGRHFDRFGIFPPKGGTKWCSRYTKWCGPRRGLCARMMDVYL